MPWTVLQSVTLQAFKGHSGEEALAQSGYLLARNSLEGCKLDLEWLDHHKYPPVIAAFSQTLPESQIHTIKK